MELFTKSIKRKIAIPSIVGGIAICVSVLISSNFTEKEIALESGLKMADLVAKQSSEMRKIYAGKIMPKIQQNGGFDSPEWEKIDGAVPAAATLVNLVGHNISQAIPGVSLKLYSEYPFKNRDLNLDDFERRALDQLKKDTSKPYYELVKKDGKEVLKYALPDVMGEGCVKCHNSHPLSQKTDWKEGDFRGAVEVVLPVDSLEGIISTQFNILQGVLISILLLMMGGLLFVAKSIVKDALFLQSGLNDFFSYLNRDKSTMNLIELNNKDEFGQMAKTINENIIKINTSLEDDMRVIKETVNVADKVESGIYSSRVIQKSNNPTIDSLIKTFNKMIDGSEKSIKDIRATLESYIKNDYTQRISIDSHLKEDILAVMQSVNVLGDSLKENAKSSLENGNSLNKNAEIMSKIVESVAIKANQQAASLEETAAALEEILSITRNTTENTLKMSNLSNLVSSSVNSSRELATKTTDSMEDINTQVKEINEAIAVIDQIAFQTNILSLNAAVEAATAGEAGKGFAVVAQEVRNLANRSAEAAKGIKKIVEDATKKADEGKEISNQMIERYEMLNENIIETIKLINTVSTGSKEQMQGIEQINDAVNLLDKVTQENANEASEVSNISQKIKNMAHNLVEDAKLKKI